MRPQRLMGLSPAQLPKSLGGKLTAPVFRSVRSGGVIGGAAFEPGNLAIETGAVRRPAGIVDISSGPLQVRLAESEADIDAVQALRYRIFYETPGARPQIDTARRRRDSTGLTRAAITCWCSTIAAVLDLRSSSAPIA